MDCFTSVLSSSHALPAYTCSPKSKVPAERPFSHFTEVIRSPSPGSHYVPDGSQWPHLPPGCHRQKAQGLGRTVARGGTQYKSGYRDVPQTWVAKSGRQVHQWVPFFFKNMVLWWVYFSKLPPIHVPSRFQANPPLTKKRQLFPGLQPASGGSIASQLWPSRGGELHLQVREYWPGSLSTRGRTPARGRPAPPLRAELP